MHSEGPGTGAAPSRRQQVVQLIVLSGLTAFTVLFGLWGSLSVAEAIGPSETQRGRVLERSSFEWTNQSCFFDQPAPVRLITRGPCTTFSTPAGAVTGEFPDGETWVVLGDDTGTSPSDVASRPGQELDVTTSLLTGRIIALDNGRSFESRWSQIRTLGTIVVIGFGSFMIVMMALLLRMRRKRGQSFDQLPRAAVIGAFGTAIALGALGAWVGAIQALNQYRVPSSADRYGALIANPYDFAGSAEAAADAGRAIEIPGESVTVRALEADEVTPEVQSILDEESRPIVAVVAEARRRLLLVEVLADSGEVVVEAEPCELEFPTPIGVDDRVSAGLYCLPADVDPASTILIRVNGGAAGLPIAAPLLD